MEQHIQDNIWLYGMLCRASSKLAIKVTIETVASLLRPPKVENIKGVKAEADSTLRTWSPYSCFFSSSCLQNKDPTWVQQQLGVLGWNTLISKNAPCRLPQNPLAWISSLASSLRLEQGPHQWVAIREAQQPHHGTLYGASLQSNFLVLYGRWKFRHHVVTMVDHSMIHTKWNITNTMA